MDWMPVANSHRCMDHSTGISYLHGLDARGNGGPGVLMCYFAVVFHIYLDMDERGDEGPGVLRCYFGIQPCLLNIYCIIHVSVI